MDSRPLTICIDRIEDFALLARRNDGKAVFLDREFQMRDLYWFVQIVKDRIVVIYSCSSHDTVRATKALVGLEIIGASLER